MGVGDVTKRICRDIQRDHVFKEHTNRESCTIVESVATDGFVLTPLIIFKGRNHLAGWYKDKKEHNFWYTCSEKGYNNSEIFFEYMKKIFVPETRERYDKTA